MRGARRKAWLSHTQWYAILAGATVSLAVCLAVDPDRLPVVLAIHSGFTLFWVAVAFLAAQRD